MTPAPGNVLIVGAGLAGARCAETLRAEGFEGRVVLVGAEAEPPYERPALSKELLAGPRQPEDVALRAPGWWAEREIELVSSTRIGAIDPVAEPQSVLRDACSPGMPWCLPPGLVPGGSLAQRPEASTRCGRSRMRSPCERSFGLAVGW